MRVEGAHEAVHLCFFYSPGAHHPLTVRKKFYDTFSLKFCEFATLGRIFLMGDTNARLGSYLNYRNIHGKHITNSNMPLLREFIEYTGVTILNKEFCPGTPTYEIVNRKRSVIDLCFTNSLKSVLLFEVEQTPLGVNSQTCHKPLILHILLNPPPLKAAKNVIT